MLMQVPTQCPDLEWQNAKLLIPVEDPSTCMLGLSVNCDWFIYGCLYFQEVLFGCCRMDLSSKPWMKSVYALPIQVPLSRESCHLVSVQTAEDWLMEIQQKWEFAIVL